MHQRVFPFEAPCFGHEKDLDELVERKERSHLKFVLFVLLAAFTAYSGYRTHNTAPGAWSDRWTGLFWLSAVVLVGWIIVSLPKIGRSRLLQRG